VEGSGVKAWGDAKAAAVGEDQFQGRSRFGIVMLDVNREEGDRGRSLGRAWQAIALLEGSSPGVEGGNGEALAFAEGTDGEAAGLPAFDESLPVLLLGGIAGLAVGHGQYLRDRVKKDHIPKVTTATRTGSTVRLR